MYTEYLLMAYLLVAGMLMGATAFLIAGGRRRDRLMACLARRLPDREEQMDGKSRRTY